MTKPLPYVIDSQIPVDSDFASDPATWLVAQARRYGLRYLLAHADDGVIWGRVDTDGLHTSRGVAPGSPELRASTLQQARLFGPAGELLLWRNDEGLQARLITDANESTNDVIDEDQILWGDTVENVDEDVKDGFTLVREGAQGMRHAVPIPVTKGQLMQHELRLRVRHYVTDNEDGEAIITLSRLVQLLPESN